jgi:3-oxoadipate CoA-transferase alpha subunit
LIKCETADRYGNLLYNKTARNFGPIMCMSANSTIVQAKHIVELGEINPESVVTPGIFVKKVVHILHPVSENKLISENFSYL